VSVVLGLTRADPGRFADNGGHSWLGVRFAAGLAYVTYEGFCVVTNSAGNMRDPARELPRAMFLALGIVIGVYILVSAVIVMPLRPADPRARRLRGDRGGRAAGYGLPRERHDVRRRQPCLQGVEVW
jgi:amino acid permease